MCDKIVWGRDRRPAGVCYGPGHARRSAMELSKAGMILKERRNKGPQH